MDSSESIKKATGRSTPWLNFFRIGIRSTGALHQGRIKTSSQSQKRTDSGLDKSREERQKIKPYFHNSKFTGQDWQCQLVRWGVIS